MAFGAAERNGRFGGIQCQKSEESSSRGKKITSIPLHKDSESHSKKQSHSIELSEIEGRGRSSGWKTRERGIVSRIGR